jgi:hypothetical protein
MLYVRHNVVAGFRFYGVGAFEVNVAEMLFYRGNGFAGDSEAEFLLCFRKRKPEPAPDASSIQFAEQCQHFG